ncbi:MAG TPA: hypothetical protein VFU36_13955, partial [Jatrophihabitans sp.]|nr:hypothetical protein [Jatrophihabitans sp.]
MAYLPVRASSRIVGGRRQIRGPAPITGFAVQPAATAVFHDEAAVFHDEAAASVRDAPASSGQPTAWFRCRTFGTAVAGNPDAGLGRRGG